MIIVSRFKPAWWLTNAHAQTIYASISHPTQAPNDRVEKLELPDGDFLNLVWSTANLSPDTPLIVIMHGLGGSVNSSYVPRFMQVFNEQGWRVVLMQLRGAGDELNRLPRTYHSGDTGDFNFLMQVLERREPKTNKAVVGVSLGGNILLKWLGEQGHQSIVKAAVAVSVPFVLNEVADKMNRGFSRLYQKHMLSELKVFFARKNEYLSNPPEAIKNAAACNCFWTFDHKVTAPLHGFASVHSYYRESSSRQYLKSIQTPTLLIHSLDDPFMTADVLPTEAELSEFVILELSQKGGHVGFITGNIPGKPIYWLDQRIPEYLAEQLA